MTIQVELRELRSEVMGIDREIPVLGGSCREYVNLDNAATTPVVRPVLDAVNRFFPWYSSVHRGTGFKSQLSTEIYEECRRIIAKFVGADPEKDIVIFCKHATEALNKISYRFQVPEGSVVLTSPMEHHANDLPWRRQSGIPGMTFYAHPPQDDSSRIGVIAFNIEGMKDFLVAAILGYEAGIGVRSGCFCVHPYLKRLLRVPPDEIRRLEEEAIAGKKVNLPGAVRVSFGFHNVTEEVDCLIDALKRISPLTIAIGMCKMKLLGCSPLWGGGPISTGTSTSSERRHSADGELLREDDEPMDDGLRSGRRLTCCRALVGTADGGHTMQTSEDVYGNDAN